MGSSRGRQRRTVHNSPGHRSRVQIPGEQNTKWPKLQNDAEIYFNLKYKFTLFPGTHLIISIILMHTVVSRVGPVTNGPVFIAQIHNKIFLTRINIFDTNIFESRDKGASILCSWQGLAGVVLGAAVFI